MDKIQTIDEYIAVRPMEIQERLTLLRQTIHEAAPQAAEKISWEMPTFTQGKILVQFAAHKAHIGFYPGAEAIVHFTAQLKDFKFTKGGVQFPYAKPLPLDLVKQFVAYNLKLNAQKEAQKKTKKSGR